MVDGAAQTEIFQARRSLRRTPLARRCGPRLVATGDRATRLPPASRSSRSGTLRCSRLRRRAPARPFAARFASEHLRQPLHVDLVFGPCGRRPSKSPVPGPHDAGRKPPSFRSTSANAATRGPALACPCLASRISPCPPGGVPCPRRNANSSSGQSAAASENSNSLPAGAKAAAARNPASPRVSNASRRTKPFLP